MATLIKQPPSVAIDKTFLKAVRVLPQVTRVVAIHEDPEPSYVVTVGGDWVTEVPAVHRALRPLRRSPAGTFHYRTVRKDWGEPDPTPSIVLFARD